MPNSICLNMIVKNEASSIRRCLDSVRPFIDQWVIVDTGSTDGTQAIIREHLRDLPGELFERVWKDFGSNRTEALRLAAGRGAYLLLMDADDMLVAPPGFRLPDLTADAYRLTIELGGTSYARTALVSQALPWRYVGVLHEYIECDTPHTTLSLDQPRIIANFDEGEMPEADSIAKYKSHAAIFETALRDEPGNSRYVFYLAQSYHDSLQFEKSLKAYERRAAMGGWEEEAWYSKFRVARISERLDHDFEVVQKRYLDAYEFRPSRAEALVELARFCREKSRFALAHLYAERAAKIPMTGDILFVDRSAYTWRALDEQSIAAYWIGDFEGSARTCRTLLAMPELPEYHRPRIEANLKFSDDKLGSWTATGSRPLTPPPPVVVPGTPPGADALTLEQILEFSGTIRIADIGAAFIAETPPYKPLLDRGLGFLNAFEADRRHHRKIVDTFGEKARVFADILGTGGEARLHLASPESGMSSLLEPHTENLAFFNGFTAFGKIFSTQTVQTTRLDDVAGLGDVDYLKMDIQGSELSVLESGTARLAGCVAIQLEVSFVPLYRDQPCFGEVDVWMRRHGFVPHAMTDLKRWSISPLIRDNNFRVPFNQLLEGDAVYFRDAVGVQSLSDEQIKKLALIAHCCYASPDMTVHLLDILARRKAVAADAVRNYLDLLKTTAIAPLRLFDEGR